MQNKKGLLLSEGLRIVLAIVCIFLLVFFGVKLYSLFVKKTDIEQARQTFEQIIEGINNLGEGERREFLVTAPKDWSFLGDENKLYLCDISSVKIGGRGREKIKAIEVCTREGIFQEVGYSVEIPHQCLLRTIDNCFELKELPILLYLDKSGGKIRILTRGDLVGDVTFEDVLELEIDGKTLKELSMEYVDSEDKNIRRKIKEALEGYFSRMDVERLLKVERENFIWEFRLSEEALILGSKMFVTVFEESSHSDYYFTGDPISSRFFEFERRGNKYKVRVSYYNKEETTPLITNI